MLFQRNFAPYFVGNLLSSCGTWIQNISQVVLIFRLTGSTFQVAIVSFAQFIGVVILVPWTGAVADRFDRRRMLVFTQVWSAGVVALLGLITYIDMMNPTYLIAAALMVGVAKAFSVPLQQSLVPSLVAPRDLQPAVALNSVTFNLSRAVGPMIGAVLITTVGFTWAFLINALSYLGLVGALLVLKIPERERSAREMRPKLRDTIRLVRREGQMLPLLLTVAVVAVAVDPVNNLTPAFSVEVYDRSDTFTGVLTGSFGIGAAFGAALIVVRARASLRNISMAMTLVGVTIIGFGISTSGVVGIGVLFVAGLAFIVSVSLATTMLHMYVTEEHRGRVMALWSVAFLGVRPVASLVDGLVATWLGLRYAAFVMALPVLAGAVYVARWEKSPTVGSGSTNTA
ncbi:MAG: MFS transporter [Roseibacillus sp.]